MINFKKIIGLTLTFILIYTSAAIALVSYPDTLQIDLSISPSGSLAPNDQFTLIVTVNDTRYQTQDGRTIDLAGSALTIVYDPSAFEVVDGIGEVGSVINSEIFSIINDNRTNPGTPDQAYPVIGNDDATNNLANGELMLAGASLGDGTLTGSKKVFEVSFVVKNDANGNYSFILAETIPPDEVDGIGQGWDGIASVPPLVGVVEGWENDTTPNDFSDDFENIDFTLGNDLLVNIIPPGETAVSFPAGLSSFSYPVVPASGYSAYDLLQDLGDSTEVDKIMRFNLQTGQWETVKWLTFLGNSQPNGPDFEIQTGEGLLVFMKIAKENIFSGEAVTTNPSIDLVAGPNFVSFPMPPADYSAYDLLQDLGDSTEVDKIMRYNSQTGQWETVKWLTFLGNSQPNGPDFEIESIMSYLIFMKVPKAGFQL